MMFSFVNPRSQAAITIRKLLSSHNVYQEKFEVAKSIINENVSFTFSEEILRWLSTFRDEEERIFSEEDMQILYDMFLRISLEKSKAQNNNIFKDFEDKIFTLLGFWYYIDKKELYKYIDNLLDENPYSVKEIIFALTTTIISSTHPDPYKIDF